MTYFNNITKMIWFRYFYCKQHSRKSKSQRNFSPFYYLMKQFIFLNQYLTLVRFSLSVYKIDIVQLKDTLRARIYINIYL